MYEEPAFPSEQSETQEGYWNQTYEPGMRLRDYFAAKALTTIDITRYSDPVAIADKVYKIADAMIVNRQARYDKIAFERLKRESEKKKEENNGKELP